MAGIGQREPVLEPRLLLREAGAVAVLNSDFGTGIRMAAPLAMLTSLTLCAHKGILVKDGRALELMNQGLVWLADNLRVSYGNGLLRLARMVTAPGGASKGWVVTRM